MHDLPSPSQRFVIRRVRGRGLRRPADLPPWRSGEPVVLTEEVDSETDALTREEIARGLRERSLRSTDLVFEHDAWCTLASSLSFGEAARPAARHEAALRFLGGLALLALCASLMVLRLWDASHR